MVLTERYQQALTLVFELHYQDQRKGKTTPYLAHLLSVSSLVMEDGGSEDEAIAALLHDALEDHPEQINYDDLNIRFGETVADIVAGCTDTPQDYTGGKKPPWKERKLAFLEHLQSAPESVLRVALADKLHNARDIWNDHRTQGDAIWDRFNADKTEQLWLFDRLLRIFGERLNGSRMLMQFRDVLDLLKK